MEAVSSFPTPKNVKYLKSFLGLCNYYRKIVKGFAKISPSNELLKKEQKFEWSREADDAFQYFKQAMTSQPIVLKYPQFAKEFKLYTDASDTSLGYIL